jgi:hypothetical protein
MKLTRVLCHTRAIGRAAICIVLTAPGVNAQGEVEPDEPSAPVNEPPVDAPNGLASEAQSGDQPSLEPPAPAAPPLPPKAPSAPPPEGSSPRSAQPQGQANSEGQTPPPRLREQDHPLAGTPVESFSATPLSVRMGEGSQSLLFTLYGFLQTDFIYDSTRSYHDAIGTSLVARTDTYDGTVGRSQFSVRNTRIGFAFHGPSFGSLLPSAVLEADFYGNQPGEPPEVSEAAYYDSPTFRLRHAFLNLESDYIDVLVGQTYDVFGWQNYFFPTTAEFLGLPHQVFSRHTQLRLTRELGEAGPIGLDVSVAALRPTQRDSGVPDANAGIRLKLNHFKGLRTSGNGGTKALPLALGVSGVVRQYKVDAFTPPPTQRSNQVTAWGLSIDALVPVLSAADENDRGNRLTLTGSLVTGTGVGDAMTVTGGATFPTLPNPAQANPPPEYTGNIDPGLVSFDTQGVLHTIDWQAFRVGIVYYLPPNGRFFVSANYTQAYSKNMRDLFPRGGAEIELLTRVADRSRYADINLFFDATPAIRFGIAGAYTRVQYIDGDEPHNYRGHAQAMVFF